ncbi:MAG: hypothetical protein ACJ79A_20690 [Gemmatimonadaceae bacterium]
MTKPDRGEGTTRNATALAAAIAELGVQCSLEVRGGLALVLPVTESVEALQSPDTRRSVLALARQHGFTHVALELPSDRRGAGRETDAPLLRD